MGLLGSLDFGPGEADWRKAWSYVESLGEMGFKGPRQLGMQYLEGEMEPPQGCTLGDVVYALMLKSAQLGDVTAHWYIGLWYLEHGEAGGPVLPVDEPETYMTMAIAWLEAGRELCDHGTILRTEEALRRLAAVYEFGVGGTPRSKEKALAVYEQMLEPRYWPDNEVYQKAAARLSR